MFNKKNRIMITVVCLLSIVALVLGLFVAQHISMSKSRNMESFHGTVLDAPRAVKMFALTGIDREPFTNASLKGHWTLFFFGFTACGSICPTTMAELGKMYHLLDEQGVKPLPNVVMVSVDPDRDTLEKLDHYVKAFDPHFYGATGDEESIGLMTKDLGIAYARVTRPGADASENDDIEHTGTLILLNPKGEVSAFFTMPHQATLLAKDYMLLVS